MFVHFFPATGETTSVSRRASATFRYHNPQIACVAVILVAFFGKVTSNRLRLFGHDKSPKIGCGSSLNDRIVTFAAAALVSERTAHNSDSSEPPGSRWKVDSCSNRRVACCSHSWNRSRS